jgi:toxin ParE1/3/4
MNFRTTKLADADLVGIVQYGAERFGREQAEAYLRGLDAAFHRLARKPDLGTRCPRELGRGRWRLLHREHVIYYRVVKTTVVISRVLGKRQLPELHL